jgi:predicted membrane metal-binding protein
MLSLANVRTNYTLSPAISTYIPKVIASDFPYLDKCILRAEYRFGDDQISRRTHLELIPYLIPREGIQRFLPASFQSGIRLNQVAYLVTQASGDWGVAATGLVLKGFVARADAVAVEAGQ